MDRAQGCNKILELCSKCNTALKEDLRELPNDMARRKDDVPHPAVLMTPSPEQLL
jgi:hypothetical protein